VLGDEKTFALFVALTRVVCSSLWFPIFNIVSCL